MNDTLIEGWLSWLETGNVARSTLRMRWYALRAFGTHHRLTEVTGLDVQHYIARLPGGAYSRQSHLAALRSFYKWSTMSGWTAEDPTRLLHSIRVPDGVPKPVPEDVLARALARADDDVRLMLTLGAYQGLRRAEIAAFSSLDVVGEWLYIVGKGRKVRRLPQHARTTELLDFTGYAFPALRGKGDHVHPDTISNRLAGVLEGYTAHSLRHRFATRCYAHGHDVRAVQMLLGHASLETTQRYVQSSDDALTAAVQSVA